MNRTYDQLYFLLMAHKHDDNLFGMLPRECLNIILENTELFIPIKKYMKDIKKKGIRLRTGYLNAVNKEFKTRCKLDLACFLDPFVSLSWAPSAGSCRLFQKFMLERASITPAGMELTRYWGQSHAAAYEINYTAQDEHDYDADTRVEYYLRNLTQQEYRDRTQWRPTSSLLLPNKTYAPQSPARTGPSASGVRISSRPSICSQSQSQKSGIP